MPLLAFLLALLAASVPALSAEPSCGTPLEATASLLDYLQTDNYDPTRASACFDMSANPEADAGRLAVMLKQVLDARGLFVEYDKLSQDADYTDETGLPRSQVHPGIPSVYLEKKGDRWLYSQSTVAAIPALYEQTFSPLVGTLQKTLPAPMFKQVGGFYLWQYATFVLLLLVSLGAGRLVQWLIHGQVVRWAGRFGVSLDEKLVSGTKRPVTWAATGLVFLLGVPDLQLGVRSSQVLLFVAQVTLSLSIVLIAMRLVDMVAGFFSRRAEKTETKLDDQVIPLLARAAKVAVFLVGILAVLQNFGVDVGSLLAGLGLGGLAFALAAKDTLANVFGSITLFADRPFQIGDPVIIDGNIEGAVEQVGFRSTRVRTWYGSVISVPNGTVANARIDNWGERPFRRVQFTLGVTYGTGPDQLQAFLKALRAIIEEHPAVADSSKQIYLHSFGDSALELFVNFFLDVPGRVEELEAREDILLRFMTTAEAHGVSFAFPSTSVYLESMPKQA